MDLYKEIIYVYFKVQRFRLAPQIIFMDDGLPRFVCPQCGVKYKKMSGVKGHLKECGLGAKCPFCPKVVTQRRNLPKHMEKHKRDGLWNWGKLNSSDGIYDGTNFNYNSGGDTKASPSPSLQQQQQHHQQQYYSDIKTQFDSSDIKSQYTPENKPQYNYLNETTMKIFN